MVRIGESVSDHWHEQGEELCAVEGGGRVGYPW